MSNRQDIGNMAAMREALVKCRALAEMIWQSEGGEDVSAEIAELKDRISAALAAPPRNCDRFDDLKSAQRHYIEHGCSKGLGMIVDGEIRKFPWKSQFEKWLFAPATKKEGGAK